MYQGSQLANLVHGCCLVNTMFDTMLVCFIDMSLGRQGTLPLVFHFNTDPTLSPGLIPNLLQASMLTLGGPEASDFMYLSFQYLLKSFFGEFF